MIFDQFQAIHDFRQTPNLPWTPERFALWLAEDIDFEVMCTQSDQGTHLNYAIEKDCKAGKHRGTIPKQRINKYLKEEE